MKNTENKQSGGTAKASKPKLSKKALENGFSTISIMIIAPVFFLIALFLLVFPHSTTSQIEKRKLTEFPNFSFESYFSGEYTSNIAKYYDDTVPYRDAFKNIGNNITRIFGFPSADASIVGGPVVVAGNPNEKPKPNNKPSTPKKPTDADSKNNNSQTPEPEDPDQRDYTSEDAEGGYENGMLIVNQDNHWRGMELFGGGSGTTYAESLNKLRGQLPDNVKIYSMPAPLASEFYVPSNFSQYSASQAECFKNISGKLDKGIISVDACSALQKHTEEQIYCRTDHHWQPLGAYYAAQAFAKAADVPFADLASYKKVDTEGFVGTLYAFSGDSRLLNDPETFTYYEPSAKYDTYYYDTSFDYQYNGNLLVNVDVANSYLRFMGGDEQVVKIKTEVKNGRKLLIIKDSYGNAEVPFYTSSFEEIYVIDMRYFERNLVNFIKTTGVTDVLFTMSAYSAVGENADNIDNLITQDAKSKIVDKQLTAKDD